MGLVSVAMVVAVAIVAVIVAVIASGVTVANVSAVDGAVNLGVW